MKCCVLGEQTYSEQAIQSVNQGVMSFCKFLSANDTGLTGGHQSGIYIPKSAFLMLFNEAGKRGENKKANVKIKWQDDFETDSVFTYYGCGTRNEYRVTRFGRGFSLLHETHTGDLFVFIKKDIEDYAAYVLSTESDIDDFLNYFGMSPADTNALIGHSFFPEARKEQEMQSFIQTLGLNFPMAAIMSEKARYIYNLVYDHIENIIQKPDKELLGWLDMEYELFRKIEDTQYGELIQHGFPSMQSFIDAANSILNRRKSRAGKSLENHLAAIFDGNSLQYETQIKSEGNKKPDFIFPGADAYHNMDYDSGKLIFLGAKTTCKDRWRQILNEANRIPYKHLFTLQQGISPQQLEEMQTENVVLVVPEQYINLYPPMYRASILSLQKFISFVREKAE